MIVILWLQCCSWWIKSYSAMRTILTTQMKAFKQDMIFFFCSSDYFALQYVFLFCLYGLNQKCDNLNKTIEKFFFCGAVKDTVQCFSNF